MKNYILMIVENLLINSVYHIIFSFIPVSFNIEYTNETISFLNASKELYKYICDVILYE